MSNRTAFGTNRLVKDKEDERIHERVEIRESNCHRVQSWTLDDAKSLEWNVNNVKDLRKENGKCNEKLTQNSAGFFLAKESRGRWLSVDGWSNVDEFAT